MKNPLNKLKEIKTRKQKEGMRTLFAFPLQNMKDILEECELIKDGEKTIDELIEALKQNIEKIEKVIK